MIKDAAQYKLILLNTYRYLIKSIEYQLFPYTVQRMFIEAVEISKECL